MPTENFYLELTTLNNFLDITDAKNFVSVPNDWYIIVTDITNSTNAIELGRYKDVNLLGACSIVTVLNVAGKVDIPFVFGGDGASILIPPSLLFQTKQALSSIQHLAKTEFEMDLRVGIVPVADVTAANYDIKVAKLKVSENYSQAVFTGGGLFYATELIKDPSPTNVYRLGKTKAVPEADLSGLECRWQDIPSRHGEVVSLLVLATAQGRISAEDIYKDLLAEIEHIYGDEINHHPVVGSNLKLTFDTHSLSKETKLRAKSSSWLHQQLYLRQIQLENFLGKILMQFRIKTEDTDWGTYKKVVIGATDYRKFDDILRMIISGNVLQREKLANYLESQFKEGKLVYGLHVSDRALMTCLVFERNGPQVHFVDGADGGYALAAKALKERMKRKVLNWSTYLNLIKRKETVELLEAKSGKNSKWNKTRNATNLVSTEYKYCNLKEGTEASVTSP